jgi:hypothetical protein
MVWREVSGLGPADLKGLVERKTRWVQAVHRLSWEDARARVLSRQSPEFQAAAARCGLTFELSATTTEETTMTVHSHTMTRAEAQRQLELRRDELKKADPTLTPEAAYARAVAEPEGKRLYDALVKAQAEEAPGPVSSASASSRQMALAKKAGGDAGEAAMKCVDVAVEKILSRVAPGTMTREAAMTLAFDLDPSLYPAYVEAMQTAQHRRETTDRSEREVYLAKVAEENARARGL